MSPPLHFFHVWVGDHYHGSNWLVPAREHYKLLAETGWPTPVRVGIVGGVEQRVECMNWLRQQKVPSLIAATADEGFEQVTISAMYQAAKDADPDQPFLYAHTKGAFQDHPANHRWRQAMDRLLIEPWEQRVGELAEYEAIGLHWLTHAQYPQWIDPRRPMFGGNFWWARAGYLAKLDPVETTTRWHAEGWMGQGFPHVLDLVPGWPDYMAEA